MYIKELYFILLVSLTMDGEVKKLRLEGLEMQFQSKLFDHTWKNSVRSSLAQQTLYVTLMNTQVQKPSPYRELNAK